MIPLGKQAYIVESGENANGGWIKYSNGIMICYKQPIVCEANKTSANIIFPVQFVNEATILLTNRYSNAKNIMWSYGNINNKGFDAFPIQNNLMPTVETKVSYIAIGKWK